MNYLAPTIIGEDRRHYETQPTYIADAESGSPTPCEAVSTPDASVLVPGLSESLVVHGRM